MCLSCCWEAVALGGADPGRTGRLGEGLPPSAQSSPLPAAVTLAAMFAPLRFLGPFLPRQAEATPRSGRNPQGAADGPQRALAPARSAFSAPTRLCSFAPARLLFVVICLVLGVTWKLNSPQPGKRILHISVWLRVREGEGDADVI